MEFFSKLVTFITKGLAIFKFRFYVGAKYENFMLKISHSWDIRSFWRPFSFIC